MKNNFPLISIIITSVMVAAMYTSYNVVSGAYKQVSDKAKISGSSRDLVTMIMRDIRMAGFRYYAGEHAAQEFLNNPLNATCVADGLRLTERNYISFNTSSQKLGITRYSTLFDACFK